MVTTFGGSGPNHAMVPTNAARISSVAMPYNQNAGRTNSACFSVMVTRTPIGSALGRVEYVTSPHRQWNRCSCPQPQAVRVIEWLAADQRAAAVTQDFDLELGARRGEIGPQVGERNAVVQPVAIATGGHETHPFRAPVNDRDRRSVRIARLDEQRHQTFLRACGRLAAQRVAPDEIGFLIETYETVQ